MCQYYAAHGKSHFVCSSGGNAGIAVAYCGHRLNIPTTVFLPSTSHQIFIDAIERYGAVVEVAGDVWDEADEVALAFSKKKGAAYIPPFDHPLIWNGHATMINEVAQEGLKPDAVVTVVGGGGLACGILEGMRQEGWDDVPLVTVETEGAASFAKSVEANALITLDEITTQATSLGTKRVAERLFQWHGEHTIVPLVISDRSAARASRKFADEHRLMIGLSSGAALSIFYENHPALSDFNCILVIVCGGIRTSIELIQEFESTCF